MAKKISGVEEILGRWRKEIMGKRRRIISFDETVEIKINALKASIVIDTEPLDTWEIRQFIFTRHRERQFIDEQWRPIRVGQKWGGPGMSAMFRCQAAMPPRFKGKKVALKVYFGGDSLLYLDGKPYHGLDPFRDTVPLTNRATGREQYRFDVESFIFWHFGETETKDFEASCFAVIDEQMHDAYWDFRAAYNVMVRPGADEDVTEFLKAGMAKAIAFIDQNETDPQRFRANALKAQQVLRREIYETSEFRKRGLVHLCGNSHLDVVFLWTHAEFVRKLGRTHATTLRLMEQYPEYIFSQSQPLMYEEMKNNYPDMYEEVKQRVKDRRWEVIGAMWVEPDCMLVSGESFTRQLLYGIAFIEQEFGITPRTCWCPDVFGNAWTMPQILVKAGLKYFVTHKMVVWNDTNPWVKNNFWWQGPDGSRIFSVVPPTHFIGTIDAAHISEHWANFNDKRTVGESLYNYGWGDGGGGPDPEMLEYLKRYGDFPGMVPAKPALIEDAMQTIMDAAADSDLPVWNDELYLEEHRGVFTTKARLKKLNRSCERLYRKAELFSCFSDQPYPAEALREGWKTVLTNQFHDSLPGSHIPPVYLDLLEAYDTTVENGEKLLRTAQQDIAARIDTTGAGQSVVVFNDLPQPRDTIVYVAYPEADIHVVGPDGRQVPHQFVTQFETGQRLLAFWALELAPGGYTVYRILNGPGPETFAPVKVSAESLENEYLLARFNAEGELTSLYDKAAGREALDSGQRGNVMHLYEDVPGNYEAWDIAPSYTDVEFDISGATLEVAEQGPVLSSIRVSREFRNSRMVQHIVLGRCSRRLDFQTWVDWKEQQKLLKVRFNTTVNTRLAAYDIAYGTIERSSYRNNSFDQAKFEVPAHFWMDLSQPDFGVSLLNDCKYGHEAFGSMMALTLLRGPVHPDPQSDQEEHYFTYSLYAHAGDWREGGTTAQGLDLNHPADAVAVAPQAGSLPGGRHSFVAVNAPNIVLEALKKAEDSDDIVIRLVERHGKSGPVEVRFDRPIEKAVECNLLEREDSPYEVTDGQLCFACKPFEIRTFKLKLK
jgi:alpha-mannosidase